MPRTGRPPSLDSQRAELFCELEALTQEGIRNEIERLRVMRRLATLSDDAATRRELAGVA